MRTSVLYEATDLTTRAALAAAVAQMREYFNEHHLAPPPLPQDVLELVPCSLSATETQTNAGKIGRLIIAKLDGVVLYESEWTIAPAWEGWRRVSLLAGEPQPSGVVLKATGAMEVHYARISLRRRGYY